jgi:hypothetical protein
MAKYFRCGILLALSAPAVADLTLHKFDGNDCLEVTINQKDKEYVKSAEAGMQVGFCADIGFTEEVQGESVALRIPFVSKPLTFTRMRMSMWNAAKLKAQNFFSAGATQFLKHRNAAPQPVALPAMSAKPIASDETSHILGGYIAPIESVTLDEICVAVPADVKFEDYTMAAACTDLGMAEGDLFGTSRRLGMFDGFAKAFENEKMDRPAPKNPGLSGSGAKKQPVEVIVMGKKGSALPGQRLKDVVRASRAPIRFNCEDGKCGTCESKVNGRNTRVCVAKVPNKGPVRIEKKR